VRSARLSVFVAVTLAVVLSACGGGAQPAPTTPSKPAETKPAASPAASPGGSPSPVPAASPSPSPVAKPAAAVASPSPSPSPSPAAQAATGGAKPTVRMGSTNFSEQIVLAEMYGQVLEANGYRVERRLNLGNREIVFPAIESGQIDMYPEYLATMLAFATQAQTKPTSDAVETYRLAQEALRPRGITVLDFAPAINTNGFVVTRQTAERRNLSRMSDLTPIGGELVLGGPPECPQRPFCLQGLRETYGINFREFRPLDAGGPLTVAALEAGQIDVALLFTTDAVITARNFTLLQDDKNLQLADNVAPVVRDQLLSQVQPDFRTAVNGVSAQLTTQELTELNRQVGIERREPRDVAAAWLRTKGLVR
jgi:osmoprotectant transport system substrate-binding protein